MSYTCTKKDIGKLSKSSLTRKTYLREYLEMVREGSLSPEQAASSIELVWSFTLLQKSIHDQLNLLSTNKREAHV